MKVVLLRDVEKIGSAGEQKDVADGFARNFLIPNRLAEMATKKSLARADQIAADQKLKKDQELQAAQKEAELIDGQEFVIKVKAQKEKLFGSIDQKMVAQAISSDKIKIDPKTIILSEPIKKLGESQVVVSFPHGIEAKIKVIVEKE